MAREARREVKEEFEELYGELSKQRARLDELESSQLDYVKKEAAMSEALLYPLSIRLSICCDHISHMSGICVVGGAVAQRKSR